MEGIYFLAGQKAYTEEIDNVGRNIFKTKLLRYVLDNSEVTRTKFDGTLLVIFNSYCFCCSYSIVASAVNYRLPESMTETNSTFDAKPRITRDLFFCQSYTVKYKLYSMEEKYTCIKIQEKFTLIHSHIIYCNLSLITKTF